MNNLHSNSFPSELGTSVPGKKKVDASTSFQVSSGKETAFRSLSKAAFWMLVLTFGFAEFWINRDATNTDGISYLDVASAFARHDWSAAVNAYWSPLYPFLLSLGFYALRPAPYWQFTVAHLINFFIFVGAAGAFEFFLTRLLLYRSTRINSIPVAFSALSEESLRLLGYTLFLWTSLELITIAVLSPDMTVELFVYLAAGITLGLRLQPVPRLLDFFWLGIVLGLGYLAKAPMLPMAIVFIALALYSGGGAMKSAIRATVAVLVFAVVAGPFVAKLSQEQGHLTWGDSAKLNYAWYVNHVPRYHWQSTSAKYGSPEHPTRQIFYNPPAYGFDGPQNSTYPIWFDPAYWNRGVHPKVDLMGLYGQIAANIPTYNNVLFQQQAAIVAVCFFLFLMGGRGKSVLADLKDYRILLIPVLAAFGMYLPVHVEERMIAAYVVLLWMTFFAAVRFRDDPQTHRCGSLAIAAVALFTTLTMVEATIGEMLIHGPRELRSSSAKSFEWRIADALQQVGVDPGAKVAWIRPDVFTSKDNYAWARLAGVKIVAEIPSGEANQFWLTPPEVRAQLFHAFAHVGASALVVTEIPDGIPSDGWQQLGKTGYWVHLLK